MRSRLYLIFIGLVFRLSLAGFAVDTGNDNAVTALIRHQTDAGSDAGQRGDQATMESFLDRQVLFSGGDGSVGTLGDDPPRDSADAVSTLIKRQTQEFRDAGQRGDMAAMRRFLDDKGVFINEDGIISGRRDFFGGSPAAPPKGISSTVTVTDWILHHSGDVAVSSFIDDQVIHYDGQVLSYKFLSVETWIKRGEKWKLIGSQTIPLHQDPLPLTLPLDALNDYIGTYTAGPGSTVTISDSGNALLLSINGGKASPIEAEVRDIFFSSGLPAGYARTRVVFRRDASGKIAGYVRSGVVYTKIAALQGEPAAASTLAPGPLKLRDFVVHRSGDVAVATFFHDRDTPCYGQVLHQTYRSMETWIQHGTEWKMISSQGRQILPDPTAVPLPEAELSDYVGTYTVGGNLKVTISRDGDALAASTNGAKAVELKAEVHDVFFAPGSPRTRIIFRRDASGHITGYASRTEEHDLIFTKG